MRSYTDVIVIGGGPVGVTALALLGRVGLSAVGFEKEADTWPTARAVHFDGENFRLLQSLGIATEAARLSRPMTSMHVENEAREVLVSVPTGRFGDQAWHDDLTFHQPDIERLLRASLDDVPDVELRTGATVTEVRDTSTGVECTVVDQEGAESTVRARWAIAADGARSEVRRSLGIECDRFGEDTPWLVVDGHLRDSPGLDSEMAFLGHHTRPALWVRLPGERVRMEFMIMPGDDPETIVTPESVERISHGVLPRDKFTADRRAIYTFRGRVSRAWRAGRIFLAGDAAHQAPPLFGQGLCAGMRDVANLAWKLDLVKRGTADEGLLDTYESERKQHARNWVEQAVSAQRFLQPTDPKGAAERDDFLRSNPMAAAAIAPPLGPGLHDGANDDRAGRLGIQPILADDSRLDDKVGRNFVVATTRGMYDALAPELRETVDRDGDVTVLLDSPEADSLLGRSKAHAVVIRPDRYILGVADDIEDLDRLLRLIPTISHAERARAASVRG